MFKKGYPIQKISTNLVYKSDDAFTYNWKLNHSIFRIISALLYFQLLT